MKNQMTAEEFNHQSESVHAKIARLKKQRVVVLKQSHLPAYSRFNFAADIGAKIDDLMKEAHLT